MKDDDFDQLFDQFIEKKKTKQSFRKVGTSALNDLPLFKETGLEEGYGCLICRKAFDDDDIVEACNKCERYFHYRHIREWMKIKAVCPNCKQ